MTTETQEAEALRRLAERHEELREPCACSDDDWGNSCGSCWAASPEAPGSTLVHAEDCECQDLPPVALPTGTLAEQQRAVGALLEVLPLLGKRRGDTLGVTVMFSGDQWNVTVNRLTASSGPDPRRLVARTKATALVLALALAVDAQEPERSLP